MTEFISHTASKIKINSEWQIKKKQIYSKKNHQTGCLQNLADKAGLAQLSKSNYR